MSEQPPEEPGMSEDVLRELMRGISIPDVPPGPEVMARTIAGFWAAMYRGLIDDGVPEPRASRWICEMIRAGQSRQLYPALSSGGGGPGPGQ